VLTLATPNMTASECRLHWIYVSVD